MKRTVKAWAVAGTSIASHQFGVNGPLAIYRRRHHAPAFFDLQVVRCTITYDDGRKSNRRRGRGGKSADETGASDA